MNKNYILLVTTDEDNLIYQSSDIQSVLKRINDISDELNGLNVYDKAVDYAQAASDGENCALLIEGNTVSLVAKKVVTKYELEQ
jgi:hypothetical protein